MLQQFQPISLEEMDKVQLMDRVDTKFVFTFHHLIDILNDSYPEYRILEINDTRNHFYDSLYFDTPHLLMYQIHHNQKLNRHKVRFRTYANSNGLTFFEIKFKDNKEKTYKKRKKCTQINYQISNELNEFLIKHTPYTAMDLQPALKVQYYRITLVHLQFNERVTIDTQLQFDNFYNSYIFENLVVAEVKRSNFAEHTTFLKVLKKHHIREAGLSKYCTGIALTNPSIKKNNFLPKLKYFEKINNL